jgi:uncharacterized membrane protein
MDVKNIKFSEFRAQARQALEGQWDKAAIIGLIYFLFVGSYSMMPQIGGYWAGGSWVYYIFIVSILAYGIKNAFLKLKRDNSLEIGDLFCGFKEYPRILGVMTLRFLYTFLWTLLLIVPGIIKAYSYAMTPYIVKDNPNIGANEAIKQSMKMMKDHKMDLFALDLTFIGWGILSLLTAGLGFILLEPYFAATRAAYYEALKQDFETIA